MRTPSNYYIASYDGTSASPVPTLTSHRLSHLIFVKKIEKKAETIEYGSGWRVSFEDMELSIAVNDINRQFFYRK